MRCLLMKLQKIILLMMLVMLPSVFSAVLDCNVTQTSCIDGTWTKILALSNYTNAHAEIYDVGSPDYDWFVCCRDSAESKAIDPSTGTKILGLSNYTNAHVEEAHMNSPDYLFSANLSVADNYVVCTYSNPACPVGYECIVSINETLPAYPNTSMHVAQCGGAGVYDEKVCCMVEDLGGGGGPEIPEFSFTGVLVAVVAVLAGTLIIRKRVKK